jgi:hypothetical protein
MAKRSKSRGARGGWVAAVVKLLAFCGLAFVIGMGLGLFADEPGLVLRYSQGELQEIPWSLDAVPEAQGERGSAVIAAKLVSEGPGRAKAGAPPPQRRTAGTLGYLVQVGAFESVGAAEDRAKSLQKLGFEARVVPLEDGGSSSWRVRVGPYSTRDAARREANRLEEQGIATWVLAADGAGS